MRRIKVRFERDETMKQIDVLVRAAERDAEVEALLGRIDRQVADVLTATGENGARRVIAVDEIVSISVAGKQARIVTEDGVYTLRQTLQGLESALSPRSFLRISRHELVNMDKIQKLDFTVSGTLRLELAGGMETWASRRCIPDIRRRLNGKGASQWF